MPEPPGRSSSTYDIGFALAEPRAARRAFDRAAETFESASFVHDRARAILYERLEQLRIEPRLVVDLGCGPGPSTRELCERFPQSNVLASDWSFGMCRRVAQRCEPAMAVVADAAHLPFATASVDLVFANLMLPSCRPEVVFAEVARVLSPVGLFLFATLGPATLAEVREAWRQADSEIHVHAAFEAQMIGDWLARAGLTEPVVDVDRLSLRYSGLQRLHADLRAVGGTNTAAGRRRTLTGVRRWRRYVEALQRSAGAEGQIAITCELILGAAWGRPPRSQALGDEGGWHAVPVASIKRRSSLS